MEKTHKKLKCILLNKRNQSEKSKYCMIITIQHFGKDKTMKIILEIVVARALGEELANRWSQKIWGTVSCSI
jgi:hypothetical protein